MPLGNGLGIRFSPSESTFNPTPPLALTSFSVADVGEGPFLGRLPMQVQAAAPDPNLYGLKVYLVPTGEVLNRTFDDHRTFPLVAGVLTDVVYGSQDLLLNFIDGQNVDFAAAGPPPDLTPRSWSIGGGKLNFEMTINDVMTSVDGVNWTIREGAFNNSWEDIAWSPTLNLFAAVSLNTRGNASNRIMTSPDGIVWTSRVAPEEISLQAICWGGPAPGAFIAVGNAGTTTRCIRSTDGITWTIVHPAVMNTRSWTDVVWSPELNLFVAVSITTSTSRVATSPDGTTWTLRASGQQQWRSVDWSPALGLFCAVASSGTGQRVMTSPNGTTWTMRDTPADYNWRAVVWSPELAIFCAIASSGNLDRVMTSPDGINWTAQNLPGPLNSTAWFGLTWAASLGLFVGVGENGSLAWPRIVTSPDGINWTFGENPIAAASDWNGSTWSPSLGMLVAVSASNPPIYEYAYWDLAVNVGETWRAAFDLDAVVPVLGNVISLAYMNNDAFSQVWATNYNTVGQKLGKQSCAIESFQWGFLVGNTQIESATIDNVILFKETPTCAPQGVWDIYAFPVNISGVEGPGFTPVLGRTII